MTQPDAPRPLPPDELGFERIVFEFEGDKIKAGEEIARRLWSGVLGLGRGALVLPDYLRGDE
mgnify:CR=1 FL=1